VIFLNTIRVIYISILINAILASPLQAGFLEMPDTAEVPEYERESLLLDLDIPDVRNRDPDPEAGPRLNVKEFRVQGLVEYPDLGITRKEIIDRIEKIRFDIMDEGNLLDSGYTPDEISQLSDLVAEIEKETTGRHVSTVDVQKLVFLIREQRRKRGVTVGMIESVANTITLYYREHGFILAKAYIPKQHVRDGVVVITLLLGELGDVNVENNSLYSKKIINRIFNDSIGKPVINRDIEKNLYLVNDLPGLSASGYFEPGVQVGDTKLTVNALSENRFSANVRLDNHGSESTGEYRLYSDIYWNNLTGIGDQLQVGVLGSFRPENSTYGSIRYSLPIYTPKWNMTAGFSNNDFITASSSTASNKFEVTGTSRIMDVALSYKINRSRVSNSKINIGYSKITSDINFGDIKGADTHKSVNRVDAYYAFDYLNEKYRTLHQGNILFAATQITDGSEEGQNASPSIISYDYSRLSFIDIPFITQDARWVLRSSGQYSGEALSEVLQFGLAGPARARGYKINEFYADDGIYLGSDLIFNGPSFNNQTIFNESISSIFQPFIFLDASYGKNNSFIEGEKSIDAYLINIGYGLKINFKNSFRGEVIFATPIDSHNSIYGTDDDDDGISNSNQPKYGSKIYFNVQYGF
jgi:hemolysin activation/secretion protein